MYLFPDAWCIHTCVTPCSRVSISIFLRIYTSYQYTYPMFIQAYWISWFNSSSQLCVIQHRLCTHSIHINTYSCVHIFTKTVLNKIKRINVNKWIWNKICIYACLEYAIKLKIYIYIYIYELYRGPATHRTVMISQYRFNKTKQTHMVILMWYQHKAKYTVIFMSYLQETNHCGEL